MNTDGTGFYTCKECHQTEPLWNRITTDHKEEEKLEDRGNVGENSCNSADGTDQRVQCVMFMMMMMMMICWPAYLYNLVKKANLVHNFFSSMLYLFSLHVSGNYVPIIRRNNCIYATLGTRHSVWMTGQPSTHTATSACLCRQWSGISE
jgi:hypothetical protein